MYSLLQIVRFACAELKIENLESVFEFGGGYGSFCRMIHNLGFTGDYIIYDLPEFLQLQKIYLNKVIGEERNILFLDELENKGEVDLFISLWALDESPVELRNRILENVEAKYFLFAFNNVQEHLDYFLKWTAKKTSHRWMTYDIPHLPGNNYLLGARKYERMG